MLQPHISTPPFPRSLTHHREETSRLPWSSPKRSSALALPSPGLTPGTHISPRKPPEEKTRARGGRGQLRRDGAGGAGGGPAADAIKPAAGEPGRRASRSRPRPAPFFSQPREATACQDVQRAGRAAPHLPGEVRRLRGTAGMGWDGAARGDAEGGLELVTPSSQTFPSGLETPPPALHRCHGSRVCSLQRGKGRAAAASLQQAQPWL